MLRAISKSAVACTYTWQLPVPVSITGNLRAIDAMGDKARTAARHKDVDHAAQAHEHVGRGTIGRLDDADASGGHAGRNRRIVQHMRDGGAGLGRQGTAAQHAGVARLQADARSIGGDVGARLVNDGHHAERDRSRARAGCRCRACADSSTRAERVGQRHQVLKRAGHGL